MELTPTFGLIRLTCQTTREEMISRTQAGVAEGQKRIVAQQARVAALDRKDRRADEPKQLLKATEDTLSL